MKKLSLYTILVFAIFLLLVTFAVAESSGSCGENATWHYDEEKAVLTISGTGETDNYINSLPNQIKIPGKFSLVVEEGITSIGDFMFGYGNISTVSLPSTLTKIERKAFFQSKIEEINIPEKLEYVGESAFSGCLNVKTPVDFLNLKTIGSNAFANSTVPKKVELSTTSVSNSAFENCSSLTEVTFDDSIETIMENAFKNCKNLNKVNNFEKIKAFFVYAFSGCEGLNFEKFIVKNDVKYGSSSFSGVTIHEVEYEEGYTDTINYLFYGCKQLKKVTLPSTITTISIGTFKDCESLDDINIPESVKTIDSDAFKNCGFTSVTIRKGIGYYSSAYSDCKKLKEVVFEEGKTYVIYSLFSGCSALEKVELPTSVVTITSKAFSECRSLKDIDLSNITKIESGAFAHCSSLAEVNLPKIREIQTDAFLGCLNLRKVNTANINHWATVTFGNEYANPVYYAKCIYENDEPVIFPHFKTVVNIKPYTFINCSSFLSISFGTTVSSVGKYAFSGCSRLKTIILQEEAEFVETTFDKCDSLRNFIDFPGMYGVDGLEFNISRKVTLYTTKYNSDYEEMNVRYELLKKHNCETDGHKYVDGYFDLICAPTCTAKGQADYKCIFCGKIKWNSIGKLNHIYNKIATEPASMEADGKIIERCSLCMAEKETAIPKIAQVRFRNGDMFYRDSKSNDVTNSLVTTDSAGKEIYKAYVIGTVTEWNETYGVAKISFYGDYTGSTEIRFRILPEKVNLKVKEYGQTYLSLKWDKPAFSSQCPVEIFISEDNKE
ncbi:MAG: leucine-rich repeat domain-containing protein, partial [Acutalibacteraceae bacterium]